MFACIYIPDFPVEAIARSEPLLREQAVAVLEGKPPLVRVVALNEKAHALGLEMGMTKLRAAAFAVPGNPKPAPAVLRLCSAEQETSAHSALLDVAHAFTPRVEDTAPDTLLLDLVGLDRLYGSPVKTARDLASRVCAIGLESNIAVAANPDTAMHAARGFSGVTVIPPGKEAQRLGSLPLHVLLDGFDSKPSAKSAQSAVAFAFDREQMLDTLKRWGVRDFRALALLPEHALAFRLGETATCLQRMARGATMRTLVLCEPQSHFEEAMELESAVENLEPLSFIFNRLLEQLCARLEARALAAQELHLRLQLERRVADEGTMTAQELDGAAGPRIFQRSLRLPVAMRDAKVFLKLLQLELAAHPPGAPILKVWITATPAPPRSAQRGLFLPLTPEAERLEITLARIGGVVGERRAGIARVLDTNRPDGFCMERFAAQEPSDVATPTLSGMREKPQLALRVFRPARQLRVNLAEGRPMAILGRLVDREREPGPSRSMGS
jgi:protein ImuB